MTITVVGHLCLDVIQQINGKETQSYGGIFFSLATLANLLSPDDTIFPIFGVGTGEFESLIDFLKKYPNVDTSGIYKFNKPTNRVHLYYKTPERRQECSQYISEPIPWRKIRSHLGSNMVLVNMVSGFDITLETLDEIRMEARENGIPIYLDVHSLTLGIKENYTRYHRPVENWRRWLFMLHAVQMNEEEASVITAEKFDEINLANHILALNTGQLILTRGERGCTIFMGEHKQVRRLDIPQKEKQEAADATGCGDVFAAAYSAKYLETSDSLASVHFANKVAAYKAKIFGSNDIDKLSRFRNQQETIGEVKI